MGLLGFLGRGAHSEGGITRVVCNPSHSGMKPSGFVRQLYCKVKLGALETGPACSCVAGILLTETVKWGILPSVPESQVPGKSKQD